MKRRLMLILIVLLGVFVLAGCNSIDTKKHNYTFRGESANWNAELTVEATEVFDNKNKKYDTEQNITFMVTYKGDVSELANIKKIDYSYKAEGVGGSSMHDDIVTPPKEKTFKLHSGSKGGALIHEDQVIQGTVTVDGITEHIELSTKK
ncbi:MAG: hypothetical protein ACM32O_09830 [Clostridia bacterium]